MRDDTDIELNKESNEPTHCKDERKKTQFGRVAVQIHHRRGRFLNIYFFELSLFYYILHHWYARLFYSKRINSRWIPLCAAMSSSFRSLLLSPFFSYFVSLAHLPLSTYSLYSEHDYANGSCWRGESHTIKSLHFCYFKMIFIYNKWAKLSCHISFSPCITNHKHRIYHFCLNLRRAVESNKKERTSEQTRKKQRWNIDDARGHCLIPVWPLANRQQRHNWAI